MNQKRELYTETLEALRLYRYACLNAPSMSEAQNRLQSAFDLTQYVIKHTQNDGEYLKTRDHIMQVMQTLEHAKPLSIVHQNTRKVSQRLSMVPDKVDAKELERTIVRLFELHRIDSEVIQKCLFDGEPTEFLSPLSTGYLIFSILAAMYTTAFPEKKIVVHPLAISKELDRAVFIALVPNAVRVVIIDDVIETGKTMKAAIALCEKHFQNLPVYPHAEDLY